MTTSYLDLVPLSEAMPIAEALARLTKVMPTRGLAYYWLVDRLADGRLDAVARLGETSQLLGPLEVGEVLFTGHAPEDYGFDLHTMQQSARRFQCDLSYVFMFGETKVEVLEPAEYRKTLYITDTMFFDFPEERYSFQEIYVRKQPIELATDKSGTLELPSTKMPIPIPMKRSRIYPWDRCLGYLVALANTPDGLELTDVRENRATLVQLMREWFENNGFGIPSQSSIDEHVKAVFDAARAIPRSR